MAAGRRRSVRSRRSEGLCPSRVPKTAQRSASECSTTDNHGYRRLACRRPGVSAAPGDGGGWIGDQVSQQPGRSRCRGDHDPVVPRRGAARTSACPRLPGTAKRPTHRTRRSRAAGRAGAWARRPSRLSRWPRWARSAGTWTAHRSDASRLEIPPLSPSTMTSNLGASGRSPTKRLWIVKRRARVHGRRLSLQLRYVVVRVDRYWVMRPAGWVERLSGGQEGFDSFVSEDEQRSHRSEPDWGSGSQNIKMISLIHPTGVCQGFPEPDCCRCYHPAPPA